MTGSWLWGACLPRKAKDSKQRDRKRPKRVFGRGRAMKKKHTGKQKNWGLQGKPGSLNYSRKEMIRRNTAPRNVLSPQKDPKALGTLWSLVTSTRTPDTGDAQ